MTAATAIARREEVDTHCLVCLRAVRIRAAGSHGAAAEPDGVELALGRQRVAGEHDQVGVLADLERADALVDAERLGRHQRDAAQRDVGGQAAAHQLHQLEEQGAHSGGVVADHEADLDAGVVQDLGRVDQVLASGPWWSCVGGSSTAHSSFLSSSRTMSTVPENGS